MSLSNEQKKRYRAIGHNLKPVVTVAGNGLSENVMLEINRALDDHELIKIKLALGERESRKAMITKLCQLTGAVNVQEIGKIVLVFKAAKEPKLGLSNLLKI